jgi:hypothetical protein
MRQNVEPQRGPPIAHATRHLQRLAELTVRGSVDAAGLKAAFSCADARRLPLPWGRPATSFDRQRSDAGIAVLHRFERPLLLSTSLAKRGARVFNQLGPASASLRMRVARGSRVAPMPVWGRSVALAADHEQDAAPRRDIRRDLRSPRFGTLAVLKCDSIGEARHS